MNRKQADAKKALKGEKRLIADKKAKLPPRPPMTPEDFAGVAIRSRDVDRSLDSKLLELKLLWRNAKDMGLLTDEVKATLTDCAEYAKRQAVQHG